MNKPLLFSLLLAAAVGSKTMAQTRDTSSHVFRLGEVIIKGYRDTLQANHLSSGTISKYNRLDVSHALNLLPGITLSAVGPRNESAVNVRGFDLRQVPIYLDGMPLYVPYRWLRGSSPLHHFKPF